MNISPLLARTTYYKGIKMRSRLEASWAAYLDRMGLSWQYEPAAYADVQGQYLPDFRVEDGDGCKHLEVKGVVHDYESLRRRMETIWRSEPETTLVMVEGAPESHTHTPAGHGWWEACKTWQRGWFGEWNESLWARQWEIYPGGDPYVTIDYEILLGNRDW